MPENEMSVSIEELEQESAELERSYQETLNARKVARQAFYRDCETVDDLIEARKQDLVKEISACEVQVDLLKSQWSAAVSSKDNKKAAQLEEEIAMLQARMTTKEQLIKSVTGDYNADLLQAFLEADAAHRGNVFALQANAAAFQNKIDDIIEKLNEIKNVPGYKYSDFEEKERDNAQRRFKHEREYGLDEWPVQGNNIEMRIGIPTYGL